ncbi:MAG: Zn-dependent protease [Luteolibacter sp.]
MKLSAVVTFCVAIVVSRSTAGPQTVVAIQALGAVKAEDISCVKTGIEALYAVKVEVLPEKPLPKAAFYPPRERYKADKLLGFLADDSPAEVTKVVGLTAQDVSTSKGEIADWGIFGLGQLGGRACVVSTFRLRAGKAGTKTFQARLVKVVNHELGHTFGLDHCPAVGCFMQDAGGKIATVDGESGKPCADCAARLPLLK